MFGGSSSTGHGKTPQSHNLPLCLHLPACDLRPGQTLPALSWSGQRLAVLGQSQVTQVANNESELETIYMEVLYMYNIYFVVYKIMVLQ